MESASQVKTSTRAESRATNRPLRVVHVVPALFGSNGGVFGGAERYAFELARHMAEMTPTRLISFGDSDRTETTGRLEVKVIGNPWYVRGQRSNPLALRLFRELKGADIVHCHQQHVLLSSLSALFSRISGARPFVSDLGGGGWDLSAYFSTNRFYRGHLHISQYSRRVFKQESKPWSHVISGGVDIEKFSPDPKVVRTSTVVFVGRLLPHKGVNYLIEAVPDDMRLKIIGRPEDLGFVEELKRLASGKRVEFIHDCDDEQLVMNYREAMCIVLPSVYRDLYGRSSTVPELLGQTLLEGMACGTPTICSDVASMPEIVDNGVTGFVTPPNDSATLRSKLIWLRDNPDQVVSMGKAARMRAMNRFTWPSVVERCLEIYRA